MGFSRSVVVDAVDHDRVIAVSSGTGVSLGDVPGGFEPVENPPLPIEDSPDLPPLSEVFGVVRGADGAWRLPELRPEHASPHAALHIGPLNVALETAANEAIVSRARRPLPDRDMDGDDGAAGGRRPLPCRGPGASCRRRPTARPGHTPRRRQGRSGHRHRGRRLSRGRLRRRGRTSRSVVRPARVGQDHPCQAARGRPRVRCASAPTSG